LVIKSTTPLGIMEAVSKLDGWWSQLAANGEATTGARKISTLREKIHGLHLSFETIIIVFRHRPEDEQTWINFTLEVRRQAAIIQADVGRQPQRGRRNQQQALPAEPRSDGPKCYNCLGFHLAPRCDKPCIKKECKRTAKHVRSECTNKALDRRNPRAGKPGKPRGLQAATASEADTSPSPSASSDTVSVSFAYLLNADSEMSSDDLPALVSTDEESSSDDDDYADGEDDLPALISNDEEPPSDDDDGGSLSPSTSVAYMLAPV